MTGKTIPLVLFLLLSVPFALFAEETSALYPGFPAVAKSPAFERLIQSNRSDQAKLIYLIDRFQEADILIKYDGINYPTRLAAPFARWFLRRHYKNQTPKQWIMRYCDLSIFSRDPIWVVLPDGKFVRSKKVLFDDLAEMEKLIRSAPDN